MNRPICRHCHKCVAQRGHRGLCYGCFNDLSIRDLYPSSSHRAVFREPTTEELELMVAKQLPTMPADKEPRPKPSAHRARVIHRDSRR